LPKESYEFRITILRELFNEDIAKKMSKYLRQGENVYLQNFKYMNETNHINIKAFKNIKTLSYRKEEVMEIAESIIKKCNVRYRNY